MDNFREISDRMVDKGFGKYSNIFDIQKIKDNYDSFTTNNSNSDGIISSKNMTAFGSLITKCQNPEQVRRFYAEMSVKLVFGTYKFEDEPDPVEKLGNYSIQDRIYAQYTFLYDMGEKLQPYMNEKWGYNRQTFDSFGTHLTPDDYKSEEFDQYYEQFVPQVLNSYQVKDQQFKAIINGFEQLKTQMNPEVDTQDYKDLYADSALEKLKEMADVHYNRPKPGFFARIFRTENARNYAREKENMVKLANLAKQMDSNPKDKYDILLDRKQYLKNQDTILSKRNKDFEDVKKSPDLLAEQKRIDATLIAKEYPFKAEKQDLDQTVQDSDKYYDHLINNANTLIEQSNLANQNPELENDVNGKQEEQSLETDSEKEREEINKEFDEIVDGYKI